MDLPDFFLIDLPDRETLTPTTIALACESLKHNRDRYLLDRSTVSLVKALCSLAESWLDDSFPFRKVALDLGPEMTGFSRPVLQGGLDRFFRQFTPENFEAWLTQEFGHAHRLDAPAATRAR